MTARARGVAELEALDAVFAALGHRARRTVLTVLHARGGTMTSGEIAGRFEHSWPTTTRHLGVLVSAGLVRVEQRGRERVYVLETERLESVAGAWLARFTVGAGAEARARAGPGARARAGAAAAGG